MISNYYFLFYFLLSLGAWILLIQKALNEISKDRTTIVIAHRLSTVRNADKIIVLSEGNIIESGNHNKLINNNNIYI